MNRIPLRERFLKICPKCGSANIGVPKRGIDLLNYDCRCKDCGFQGYMPEVRADRIKEYHDERKRVRRESQKPGA